jgi:hypothetical protein
VLLLLISSMEARNEEVRGVFELRSDVCSMDLRLHGLEGMFPWLKRHASGVTLARKSPY